MTDATVADSRYLPDELPPFAALFNFRDLGGYPTTTGVRTARGRVFRSDGIHRCGDDDLERLAQIGLTRVIDLRTDRERTHDGCFDPEHPTIDYHHVPVLDEAGGVAGVEARRAELAKAEAEGIPPLLATYRRVLATRGERLVEAIDLIVSAPGPVAFHCTAGKDRTGLVAALVLSSVGVPDDVVVDDYARSRAAMTQLVEWYRQHRARDLTASSLTGARSRSMLGAEPEWMRTVLDELREQHGSARNYLQSVGATPTMLDRLSERLLG